MCIPKLILSDGKVSLFSSITDTLSMASASVPLLGSGDDWKAAVLAANCAILVFFIWFPFVKFYDNKLLTEERAKAAELATK